MKDVIDQNCGLTSRCVLETAMTSLNKSCSSSRRRTMCKNVTAPHLVLHLDEM